MAENTITSTFRVNDQTSRPMRNMQTSSESLATSATRLLKVFGALFIVKKLGAAIAASVKEFGNFEAQMNKVAAVSGATSKEMEQLSKQAREMGKSTKLSAQEVAGLQFELAKLGFTTEQIMAMTGSVGELSVALGTDLAQTAGVAGKTLRQFNLEADQTARVVNVIAEVSSSSAADMSSFSEAMKFAGTTAGSLGISIEEASAAVAALSNVGLEGTLAGTGLSNVMLQLANDTSKVSKFMKDYKGDANDVSAKMQHLAKQGLTVTEIFDTFGKIAGKSAIALINNADAMADLEKTFKDGERQLDSMTDAMSKGVNYELDIMKSVVSELKIAIGSDFAPAAIAAIRAVIVAVEGLGTAFDLVTLGPLARYMEKSAELRTTWFTSVKTGEEVLKTLKKMEDMDYKGIGSGYGDLSKRIKTLTSSTVELNKATGELTVDGWNKKLLTERIEQQKDLNFQSEEAAKLARLEAAELKEKQAQAEKDLEMIAKKREAERESSGKGGANSRLDDVTAKGLKMEQQRKRDAFQFDLDMMEETSNAEIAEEERRIALRAEMAAQDQINLEQSEKDKRDIKEAARREDEAAAKLHQENLYNIAQMGASTIADITGMFAQKQIDSINATAQAEIDSIRNKGKRLSSEEKKIIAVKKKAAMEEYKIRQQQWFWDKAAAISSVVLAGARALATPSPFDDIAVGLAGAKLVADIATSQPTPPKLETGASIRGTRGGTNVIVGENGYDEEIFGMGPKGAPRRNSFAQEVAQNVNNYNGGAVNVVINGSVDSQSRVEEIRDMVRQGVRQGLYEANDLVVS